jgi:PKD repeat protein
MIKFYLLLVFCLSFFCTTLHAQSVVLQEDFVSYNGTALTSPAGWSFSNYDYFSDSLFCGPTGVNAYKFKVNNSFGTTPYFDISDSVSFWLKDSSNVPLVNQLIILSTSDSIKWDSLTKISAIPAKGKKYTFKLLKNTIQLKFIYVKNNGGSLAFDDFYLKRNSSITADFYSKTMCYGDTTFFEDWSTNLPIGGSTVKWFWKFGDNTTDTIASPAHKYATAGTFVVELKVKNAKGDIDSVKKFNLVLPRPTADFTINSTGPCSKRCIQLLDKSILSGGGMDEDKAAIIIWYWTVAGTTYSIPSPLHCFAAPGTYPIQLTAIADNGCTGTSLIQNSTIPADIIRTSFTYSINKQTVSFMGSTNGAATPINYKWYFGDGDSSSLPAPVHTFSSYYDYTVCLTGTGTNGCDKECEIVKIAMPVGIAEHTDLESFSIFPNPVIGKFTVKTNAQATIFLYDLFGNLLIKHMSEDMKTEIDVSHLSEGNYFINIQTSGSSLYKKIHVIH